VTLVDMHDEDNGGGSMSGSSATEGYVAEGSQVYWAQSSSLPQACTRTSSAQNPRCRAKLRSYASVGR
jgi:hypothetical protein